MAQNQVVIPDTLPGGFSQWDAPPSAPASVPSSAPDVLPGNFSGFDSPPDQPQGNPIVRFLKAGASKYLGATLNAGPTTSSPAMYGTPEWQRAEQEMYQRYKQGQAQPGFTDFLKSASLSNVPENALNEVKNMNPIDVQKFQSGDVAGGLGSSLMNLLLIRSGFKQMRGGAPEFGSPAHLHGSSSEFVQPLSGYTKVQPQPPKAAPVAPSVESTSTLPNATYLRPEIRAILNPKNAPPSTTLNKNVNTNVQEYFIQKMRDQMNRQTVTGSAEQDAAIQRMNEYAKAPFDRARAAAESKANAVPVDDLPTNSGVETIYRGEGPTSQKGGNYWSPDKDFAAQFTQTGQHSELKSATIKSSDIYQTKELPYAGDPDAVEAAVKDAKQKGFKAVRLDEGQNQPPSVYVFDKSVFKSSPQVGRPATPQFAYRTRDAGETGIMPLSGKHQASLDPATVQSYMEGRAAAQNHPQELVRIDLSKLDPSEYTVEPNGYVKFKSAVPESYIEKMGSKAMSEATPRVPTSDADMQNLLMQSLQMVKARAGRK